MCSFVTNSSLIGGVKLGICWRVSLFSVSLVRLLGQSIHQNWKERVINLLSMHHTRPPPPQIVEDPVT
jgi:hypothetical protein